MPQPTTSTIREFLLVVPESALGVPMTAPVINTNSFFPRLSDGPFSMESALVFEDIDYGGGFATSSEAVADHYEAKGSLKVKLYPSNAAFFLALCGARVNTGQTLPWPTTELPGDLASASFYHGVRRSDGTYEHKRWGGIKVAKWDLEVSRRQQVATLNMDLVACLQSGHALDAGAFPDPVLNTDTFFPNETDYPTGPYTFKQTGGALTVGSVRTQYEDVKISCQNALDARWFEAPHLTALPFLGRAATLDTTLYLKATPNDRTAYEALTAQACSLAFSNGVHTATFDFKGQNTLRTIPYDLPMNTAFMRKLSLKNRFDPVAGADLVLSTT